MVTAPVAPYLAGAIAVAALTHAYLWRRLVRDPALRRARSATVTLALLALLALLLPAGMLGLLFMRVLPRALASPLMATTFTWMGVLMFLILLLLVLDGIALLRRRRDARRDAFIAAFGAALLSMTSMAQALRPLWVHEQRLPIASLPTPLEGYRIAHLSDLHVGPMLGRAFVREVVEKTNAARPDLVVITGDLVDGSPEALADELAPLRDLRARDGVYLVLGNHEQLSGIEVWCAFLPSLGVRVLRNEATALRPELDLIGLDEPPATDVARAFAMRRPGTLTIALAHQPRTLVETRSRGVSVQLSGHTHGGQIFPLHVFEWVTQRYLAGVYRVGDTLLHVSPGAGYWGPPMRLGSRAEVSLLVLTRNY